MGLAESTPINPEVPYYQDAAFRNGSSSHTSCTPIKTRALPAGDIEIGHRSTATCLLGNIAFRTGQKLLWDAKAEKITNSREANGLLTRQYRAPWKLAGMEG
jgi:hypothetical protein